MTWGFLIAIYIDGNLIQGASPSLVYLHAQVAAHLFMVLGWSLIWKRSDFFPKHKTTHFGFMLDSVSRTVSCPLDKIVRLCVGIPYKLALLLFMLLSMFFEVVLSG